MKSLLLSFLVIFNITFSIAQKPKLKQVWVKKAANTYLNQDLFVDPVVNDYLNNQQGLAKNEGWESLEPGEGVEDSLSPFSFPLSVAINKKGCRWRKGVRGIAFVIMVTEVWIIYSRYTIFPKICNLSCNQSLGFHIIQ